MTIWKTLIQSKLDYCSQLWSPTDQTSIARLESISRHFTAQVAGLEGLDYWDRLKTLRLYSQERRRERYRMIFVWKVLQGYAEGFSLTAHRSPRRGRFVVISKYHNRAPAVVRQAREASLSVHGAHLFNLLPQHLRDMHTGSVDQFKTGLDAWLASVPDQPTIPGRLRAAKSNSLIDQAAYAAS